MGFSEFTMPTTEITAEKIMELFHELINNYETIQEQVGDHVLKNIGKRQSKFADRISSDLESLPEDKWAIQNNFAKHS